MIIDDPSTAETELAFEHAGRQWRVEARRGEATITVRPGLDDAEVQVLHGIWNGRRLRGFPEVGAGLRVRIALDLLQQRDSLAGVAGALH